MPRISSFELIETADQPMVYVRSSLMENEIPKFIAKGLRTLEAHLAEHNVTAAEVPFLSINVTADDMLEGTLGLILPHALKGEGDVKSGTMKGGKKIFCYYQGSNDLMGPFYQELEEFLQSKGYEIDGMYEFFMNGPEFGTDKLLTKVLASLR